MLFVLIVLLGNIKSNLLEELESVVNTTKVDKEDVMLQLITGVIESRDKENIVLVADEQDWNWLSRLTDDEFMNTDS